MHKYIRGITKFAVGIALATGLVGWYFADNIRGYYRFKELCDLEGGLKISEPALKRMGWRTASYDEAHTAAQLKHVAFVRFPDKRDNVLYDLRYLGGNSQRDESFSKTPADLTLPVRYEWVWVNEMMPGELRTSRSGFKARDLLTGQLAFQWLEVAYSTFDQNRTLLAAPSGNVCHSWVGRWSKEENQTKYFAK